jgi:TolB-like protein/DNA-binding winged helix-turn-helix (wHTH) protein/Flp pilus assembly protein TadD
MVPRESIFRFRDCVLDVGAYELRRRDRPVRLERQPMDLLILLVERHGQLVTRAEITALLWSADVFVDVETGIHTAVRKIRRALGDSADSPTYVETVAGKGYRFVAPVETGAPVAARTASDSPSPSERSGPTSAAPAAPDVAAGPDPGEIERARAAEGPAPRRWRIPLIAALGAGAVVLLALLAWRGTAEPAAPLVLGVLPFENLTGDAGQDYIVDGFVEEMIASLGGVAPERMSVIGRTSMMAYRGTTKASAEIGRELGVEYLLEGSVRTEDGLFRITSTLVRVRDQVQIWSASFDREPSRLLDLQRELSATIAEQVRLRLTPERAEALARRQTTRPEAFDLYLRGRYFWGQLSPTTLPRALDYNGQATTLDPGYALAWSGIADLWASRPMNSDMVPEEAAAEARQAADRALASGPDLSEAHGSKGTVQYFFDWDWPAAEASFTRAVELDPSNAVAHRMLGHVRSQMGRHDEGLASMRRARELDPFAAANYALSSQVAFQARRYDEALDSARQATVIDPDFWIGYMQLGQVLEELGRHDEAVEALTRSARLSGGNSKPVALRAYVLARAGRVDEARDILATLESPAPGRHVPPYARALAYAGFGDREAVFTWLDRAYETRDVHVVFLPVDPKWDPYRADPRFIDHLERAGLRFPVAARPSGTIGQERARD